MIKEIFIKNLVFIEKFSLKFSPSFNIITGETGAGKSLLLLAISILLGDRVKPSLIIGKYSDKTTITGKFKINQRVKTFLLKKGFDAKDDIIIRRIISYKNNLCYLNDEPITLRLLKEMGNLWIDIHGQNQHQNFLKKNYQLELFDKIGNYQAELEDYKKQFKVYQSLKREYDDLLSSEIERYREIDFIKYQIKEIEKISLEKISEDELNAERKLLINAKDIQETGYKLLNSLYESDNSIYSTFSSILKDIDKLSKLIKKPEILEKSEGIRIALEDLFFTVKENIENIEPDEERLEEIEILLNTLYKLKRKYGNTIEEILQYKEKISRKLKELEEQEVKKGKLERELIRIEKDLREKAERLHFLRKNLAGKIKNKMENVLKKIGFEYVIFDVKIEKLQSLTKNGINNLEFVISTNPETSPLPLKDIASGGELSRIMLALKTVFSQVDDIDTMIFDEIDTGIGGKTANEVANLLRELSKNKQIICITHLPQIASKANTHFKVEKLLKNNQTIVSIVKLEDREEKLKEINRLLGLDENKKDIAEKYLK